jgi:hypothetical protein
MLLDEVVDRNYWFRLSDGTCHLAFRPLDRPATPDDVRHGEAIFSLAGQGIARACKMPNLPQRASWTTLKDYPAVKYVQKPSGESGQGLGYEQDGIVWQAEEVQIDGRWRRYYGLVGPHGLARAPAEEIEFLDEPYEWLALTNHVLVGLKPAPDAEERNYIQRAADSDYFPVMLFYRTGQPLVFHVQAWNRSGVDQPLPALAEARGAQAPRGSTPMRLKLRYSAQQPTVEYLPSEEVGPQYSIVGMTWTTLPRKTSDALTVSQASRMAPPAEFVDCLPLDLNRLYDASRPGTYRLSLTLENGKNAPHEHEIVFAVTAKPGDPAGKEAR